MTRLLRVLAAVLLAFSAALPAAGQDMLLGVSRPSASCAYDTDACAYFARLSVQPNSTRKGYLNTLVTCLKAGSAWTDSIGIYPMAFPEAAADALLNLRQSAYNLSYGGGISAADWSQTTGGGGFLGNGSAYYLDTCFADNTAAVAWTQDVATFGIYIPAGGDGGGTNIAAGLSGGSAGVFIAPRNAGGVILARMHQGSNFSGIGVADRKGYRAVARYSSSDVRLYDATGEVNTASTASTSTVSATIQYLSGASNFSADRMSFGHFAGFSSGTVTNAFRACMVTFLTSTGAN